MNNEPTQSCQTTVARVKLFTVPMVLSQDKAGNWVYLTEGRNLDEIINEWLQEMQVPVLNVSSPNIAVIGRDDKAQLHVVLSCSITYNSQQVIVDTSSKMTDSNIFSNFVAEQNKRKLPAKVLAAGEAALACNPSQPATGHPYNFPGGPIYVTS